MDANEAVGISNPELETRNPERRIFGPRNTLNTRKQEGEVAREWPRMAANPEV
jgi:hypothetical protein